VAEPDVSKIDEVNRLKRDRRLMPPSRRSSDVLMNKTPANLAPAAGPFEPL